MVWGKYSVMRAPVKGVGALGQLTGPGLGQIGDAYSRVDIPTFGYNYTLSPTFLVDGVFGSGTRAAVVSFQAGHGLSQTGSVDAATWQELVGYSQAGDQTLCYSTGGSTASSLSSAQVANVRAILTATRNAGGNRNAQIIALMTAMQESKYCNIQFGDRDSLGLFQQRPSQGWCSGGTACVNPTYATQGFLGVSAYTTNRGLFDVSGWESMSKTLAADAVQRSCCPNAYAQWESMATTLADTY